MAYIGDKLDIFSRENPDDTALVCGPVTWTWRELAEKIEVAERYIGHHAPRAGRIALLLNDPSSLIVCFFACARSGRIAMIMDPGWPEAQMNALITSACPDLRLDSAAYDRIEKSVLAQNHSREDETRNVPGEQDLFYCGFTSGSTGTPKGYVRNHASWLRSFELSNREFGLSGRERVIVPGQLTHSLHLYGAVCGLACGHQVALMPRFDPRSLIACLKAAETGATLYATPTQLHFLASAAKRSGPLETVRQVLASGAKWQEQDRKALQDVFPNARLIEFYGASETSFISISKSDGKAPAGSVGRPPKGVAVAIGHPGLPSLSGRTGAIWVKSGLLFSGYLCGDDPETRWENGWLTFGDHGYLDAEGYLFLTGRAKRMIVTSGLNVYPEEVEAVLLAHPAVSDVVVAGLSDPVRGQRLEAAVQLAGPVEGVESSLFRHCRSRLAPGKVPRRIHVYERLPMTAGGKPDIQKVVSDLSENEGPH